jgi:hypothetical protein
MTFDAAVKYLVANGTVFVVNDNTFGFGDIYIVNLKLFVSGLGSQFSFIQYMRDLKCALVGLPQSTISMEPNQFQLAARLHIIGI